MHAAVQQDNYTHDTEIQALENGTHQVARPIDNNNEDKKPCNAVVYNSARELNSEE